MKWIPESQPNCSCVVSLAALRWWSVLRWRLGGGAMMRKPRPLRHCWSEARLVHVMWSAIWYWTVFQTSKDLV